RRLPRGIEAQCSGGLPAKAVEVFQRIIDVAKGGAGAGQQSLAGFGQSDAPGGAVDQAQAEPFLDVAERMAQRRSRYAKLGRGRAKTAMPRNRQEGCEVGWINSH